MGKFRDLVENSYQKGDFGYFWTIESKQPDISGKRHTGNISCYAKNITSLKGAPVTIDGDFNCGDNKLTSLQFGPTSAKDYICSENKLTSLEYGPKFIGGDFECQNNKLTSLKGAPETVKGSFNCQDNSIEFTKEDVKAVCDVKKYYRV